MIPILYSHSDVTFATNGVGRLTDCLSCVVTEEINGIYECEFTYPITGKYFNELINGPDGENLGIIGIAHDHNGDIQPFDIYKYSAPINGVVTFYARHVSYRLIGQIVGWENGLNVTNTGYLFGTVLQGPQSPVYPSGYSFSWYDHANYTTSEGHSMSWKGPVTARQLMFTGYRTDDAYGTESIIKSFPGEFRFDRFDVHYYRQRGIYNGVQIRYGKNMTEINREKDVSNVVTAIFPYWMSKDEPPQIVYGTLQRSPHVGTYYYAAPLDLSDKYETAPTASQLNAQALLYMSQNNTWKPQETITVNMVDLYSNTNADFTKITVGDYVDIIYPKLGVVAEQVEVISATFDVLTERFTQIQCGQFPTTYADVITGMVPSGGSSGGGSSITVDDALSSTSTNPVQNRVINAALNDIPEMGGTTSNAYIKFASGLLICYGYISLTVAPGDWAKWNSAQSSLINGAVGLRCDKNNIGHYFPVAFIAQPIINATISGRSNGNATVVRCTASATSISRLQFMGNGYPSSGSANYTFDYVAFGRWK